MAGRLCCLPLSRLFSTRRNVHEVNHDRHSTTVHPFTDYARTSGIEILRILESAAKFIPIPFIRDIIGLSLYILQACEKEARVEKRAQDLSNRVGSLMIAIVDRITLTPDNINDATEIMRKDVQDLTNTLNVISDNLNDLLGQHRFFLFFLKGVNRSKIDDCLNSLEGALEIFNVSQSLRSSEVLQDIQLRLEKIQSLTLHVADHVQQIHLKVDTVLTVLNDSPAHSESVVRRQHMPSKPRVFHGRATLTQEIALLLRDESTPRICILGPGGMGKTSLALAVVESTIVQTKYGSRRFWVPCLEAASPHLLLQLLHVQLRIGRATDDTLDDILSELNRSKEPLLVLLDNFETCWSSSEGTRQGVGEILYQISQLAHITILMTMRGADPPHDNITWQPIHLLGVDKQSSRSIFQDIYPHSNGDPHIDSLATAVGHMPFAVTLLAKLGRRSKSTAKQLLEEWLQSGTDIISSPSSAENNMNRSISLSVDHDFIKQDGDALRLLEILSLLPAGTLKANLRRWAPNLTSVSSAIATLSDAALLMVSGDGYTTETSLFVLPVVQSFMTTKNRIHDNTRELVKESCCQYILDHGSRYYEANFNEKSKALAAEDTNIQSILPSLAFSESVIKILLKFAWYRFDVLPNIDIAQHTLKVARFLGKDRYVAEALVVLGGSFFRLSKDDAAMQSLTEANRLLDTMPREPVLLRLNAECVTLLTDARTDCEMPWDSTLSLIYQAQPKFSDDFDCAYVLKALGLCLFHKGQYSEAINVLEKAKTLFMRAKSPTDVAHTLIRITRNYRRLFQYPQALEAIEEASAITKDVNHPRMCAEIECQHGLVLLEMGRHEEARSTFERCLSSFQRLGSLIMMGVLEENIGDTYLSSGAEDSSRAITAYEAAIEKYTEVGLKSPVAQNGIVRCRESIDKIKSMKHQEIP